MFMLKFTHVNSNKSFVHLFSMQILCQCLFEIKWLSFIKKIKKKYLWQVLFYQHQKSHRTKRQVDALHHASRFVYGEWHWLKHKWALIVQQYGSSRHLLMGAFYDILFLFVIVLYVHDHHVLLYPLGMMLPFL